MATVYSKSMAYPRGTNTYVSDSVLHVAQSAPCLSRKSNFSIHLPTTLSFSGINCPRRKWCTHPELPAVKEPETPKPYTQCEFDPDNLLKTFHSGWWRDDIQVYTQTPTNDPCSNFAIAYVQHLNRVGRGLIKHPLPKTISETALVREIIFMFMSPVSCGFFEVESTPTQYWEQKRISVRRNVSIPKASSVSRSLSIALMEFCASLLKCLVFSLPLRTHCSIFWKLRSCQPCRPCRNCGRP